MYINIKTIQEKYKNVPIRGIIHIGAHIAEEYESYKEIGVDKQIWVEGNPNLYENIKNIFSSDKNVKVFCEVIYDVEKQTCFNISNNLQSSSILQFKDHLRLHPDVYYNKKINVTTKRFDHLINEAKINICDYNFLNVDVQGVDLNVILSLGDYINSLDFIYSEINTSEVYEGCYLLEDYDKILNSKGFERTMIHMYSGGGWGDALWVKKIMI